VFSRRRAMNPGARRGADWLAPVGTALAFLACYGTLAVLGALSLMGIALTIHEGLWAGAIAVFAVLALAGIVLGWRIHRSTAPLLLGLAGTGLVLWAMGISYSRLLEIAGFVCLVFATALDWRAKRALPTRPD